MKNIALLILSILMLCSQARGEIVGDNYFGGNLMSQFQKITGWENDFTLKENTKSVLPTFKEINDVFEFDCPKGVDVTLSANGARHAALSVRFCKKSLIEEKTKEMGNNLKKLKEKINNSKHETMQVKGLQSIFSQIKILRSQNHIDGALFENYQFPFFSIGHGVAMPILTITTNNDSNLAVMSQMYFYKRKSKCSTEIMCTYNGELMKKFNRLILNEEEKYLTPSLNEMRSQFAYAMTMTQWQKMGELSELVKRSGAFELIRKKYPELDRDDIFDPSNFAGILHTQKDGSYRAYYVVRIKFGGEQYSDEVIEGSYNILNKAFDSYMDNYILTLINENG